MSATASSIPLLPRKIGRRKSTVMRAKVAAEDRDAFMREKWPVLLAMVREGARVVEALGEVGVDRDYLTKILRISQEARAQWDDAKLAALWNEWDLETMESILVDIAMGSTVKGALDERGLKHPGFYSLVMKDPIVKEMYDEAQQIRMEGMADEIIDISDNAQNDRDLGTGRVNHEVVARDKLKTDSRKWLMARLHWKRFGDKLQTEQNINLNVDHANQLNLARKRKEKLVAGRSEVVAAGKPAAAPVQDGELVEKWDGAGE